MRRNKVSRKRGRTVNLSGKAILSSITSFVCTGVNLFHRQTGLGLLLGALLGYQAIDILTRLAGYGSQCVHNGSCLGLTYLDGDQFRSLLQTDNSLPLSTKSGKRSFIPRAISRILAGKQPPSVSTQKVSHAPLSLVSRKYRYTDSLHRDRRSWLAAAH